MGDIVLAFDAYGTLLDTHSVADKLAKHVGETKARSISAAWRKYQLEYTWRLNSMGKFQSFQDITRNALEHALSESIAFLCEKQLDELMSSYDALSTFEDVTPALEALSTESHITKVVFSNGTNSMVTNSVQRSPDLGPHASVFQDIITVDEVQKYKPAPEVYHYLAKRLGKDQSEYKNIYLISGNPFDVVGARSVGMQAIWIDRGGNGWTDRMAQEEGLKPTEIVRSLQDVLETVEKHSS